MERVWLEAMRFMRLREVAAAAAVCRNASAAAASLYVAPPAARCGYLRPPVYDPPEPACTPGVRRLEVPPPSDLTPFQQCLLRQMLQCVHPCASLRNGGAAAELAPEERRRQHLPSEPHPHEMPVAAMIAGSFPLRQLERALHGVEPSWRPGDVDIFVLAPSQERAVRFMRTVCERLQRQLGLPWLATRTCPMPYCEEPGFMVLGEVSAPPPVGRGLPRLSFIWRPAGELRPVVRSLENETHNCGAVRRNWRTLYPIYSFDLSLCRVALWVGCRGEWVVEFPEYVATEVRERRYSCHMPLREERRLKYTKRGYRAQQIRGYSCDDCQKPYEILYRGGCRMAPPFRAEWRRLEPGEGPGSSDDSGLCDLLGVLCEDCLRSAGAREWTCLFCGRDQVPQ